MTTSPQQKLAGNGDPQGKTPHPLGKKLVCEDFNPPDAIFILTRKDAHASGTIRLRTNSQPSSAEASGPQIHLPQASWRITDGEYTWKSHHKICPQLSGWVRAALLPELLVPAFPPELGTQSVETPPRNWEGEKTCNYKKQQPQEHTLSGTGEGKIHSL